MRLTVVRGPSPAGPFDLREGTNYAGRDPACEVCLPSKRVSRKHASFEVHDGRIEVRDLGSHNGILSGQGTRVDQLSLTNGTRVQIGDYLLKLELEEEELELEEEELVLEDETGETSVKPAAPPSRSPTLAPIPTPPPGPSASGVLPPPPKLPFAPAGGFGTFGKRPPDPSRSVIVDPSDFAPPGAPEAPPPWKPDPGRDTVGGKPPAPPLSPPPRPAPVEAPRPPEREAHRTQTEAPQPRVDVAPRPFGPPRVGPPLVERQPVAPRPPESARPVLEPTQARSSGVPWLLQATLLLLAVVGLLVCSPIGGVFERAWSSSAAVREVSVLRGVALAEALANRNAQPLADQRGIALETTFLLEKEGVRAAMVADTRGTVLAPAEKLRTSITAQPAYAEASRTGETAVADLGELTQIVIPVRAQVGGAGPRQIVGYVVVEYDPDVLTNAVASPIFAAIQGLFVVLLAAGLLAAGAWWLVLRPIAALREETELALLGDQHEVVPPARLAELEQLAHSINRLAARARTATRR